jgi:hypothetical protein
VTEFTLDDLQMSSGGSGSGHHNHNLNDEKTKNKKTRAKTKRMNRRLNNGTVNIINRSIHEETRPSETIPLFSEVECVWISLFV